MKDFRIRQLAEADRWRLRPHFKGLIGEDRRLRFGAALNDAAIDRYVDQIDFETDAVLGIEDERAAFRAIVHVAPVGEGAELGLSVLVGERGQGLGGALFEQAVIWARNRFLRRIYMHCLRENRAILHLAHAHGMSISMDGSESSAVMLVPAPDFKSWVGEQATHWQALTDEVVRLETHWLDWVSSVPASLAGAFARKPGG